MRRNDIHDVKETPREVGVDLKQGYNGHLTSREAGSVGGQMVKHRSPERTKLFARKSRISTGYSTEIRYIFKLVH